MLNKLFSFIKKNYICIDIGFRNIKVAEVEVSKSGDIHLRNFSIVPTPRGCIKNGFIRDVNEIACKIRSVIEDIGIKTKDAKIVMSGTNIITRIFMIEKKPEQDLDEIINAEVMDRMPVKLDSYKTDYKILERIEVGGSSRMKVFVTAVKESIIESYINVLIELGLNPIAIDIPANSIGKFFNRKIKLAYNTLFPIDRHQQINNTETIAVLDFGSETTIVNIIRNRVIEFNRVILIGSSNLDDAIAKALDISQDKAESLKKMYGIEAGESPGEVQQKVNEAALQVVNKIIFNIKSCFSFYDERCCGTKVDKIYMIGGGSMLSGLEELLAEELKLPVYPVGLLDIEGIKVSRHLNAEKFNFLINSVGIALE